MDDIFQEFPEEQNQQPLMMPRQEQPEPKPKKKLVKPILFSVLVIMLAVAMFVSGVFYASSMGINGDMPMLIQAYKLLDKYYYKDISWSEFQEIATQAMTGSVDNFTGIVEATPQESGPSMGFNVNTDLYNRHYISFVIPDSPASKAFAYQKVDRITESNITPLTESDNVRIEIGDRLYALNLDGQGWTRVENMSYGNLRALLATAQSTVVGVRIVKTDVEYCYDYMIVKDNIATKYAYYYSCEEIDGIVDAEAGKNAGLIKLVEFSESACLDFYNCVQEFRQDPAHPNKLILDLRGNGGGDAEILGFIAKFLVKNEGSGELPLLMLNSNTGNGKFEETYYSTLSQYGYDGQTLNAVYLGKSIEDFEVVVLCNNGSASSSEALIGALQYYNGATIVGSTTYGKGVAQKVFPLSGGKYYLYITNGYYYVPTNDDNGNLQWTKCIHGVGFTPEGDNYITLPADEYKDDPYVDRALAVLKG
ncbi:MAG: S41 family peptidase [Christensenellales bacterium]